MILGSDGVDLLEQKRLRATKKHIEVDVRTVDALIGYYRRLTQVCQHEFDYSSPIDSVGLCRHCGLLK